MKNAVYLGYGVMNQRRRLRYYGLHALRHRGQEGAGIVATDGQYFKAVKGEGLVNEETNEEKLKSAKGHSAIAHVRYTTAGGSGIDNVQPLLFRSSTGTLAIAHNGNLASKCKSFKTTSRAFRKYFSLHFRHRSDCAFN